MSTLPKSFLPHQMEAKCYRLWEQSGAFASDSSSRALPFTIMMPPPNVTGSLHIGHALTYTLQDILIRYYRMSGFDTLWQPGCDHAGIATQMLVERDLEKRGRSRKQLGRKAFLEEVWAWKERSGGEITQQLRNLGASADWQRECFTLDAKRSRAVREAFVRLYRDGLLYRDKRMVNWDPALRTAVSDLETRSIEMQGFRWYIRYPLEGGGTVTVATTRPETLLGDSAVAVHPEDLRYRDKVGEFARLPLVGRRIPVIADVLADPQAGSGAVKITPGHAFPDFLAGRTHGLEMFDIFDDGACLNETVPQQYRGLRREEARKRIVADLEALSLVEKVEGCRHAVPHGDRSGVVLEPRVTDQWFVDVGRLAPAAVRAVERGDTRFIPRHWERTFFAWLKGIQPWCISRQIWWGHRIPAWYGADGKVFVAMNKEEAARLAQQAYREAPELAARDLRQDPDVLDTWFSSALWPFATLDWPERTPELKRYYPGNALVTGFDIIFFWVARMMMMGLHFLQETPFREVYIHALVRDPEGRKMSKSKGNVIDPGKLMDLYGCDALRFTLAFLSVPGRDVRMSEARVRVSRNFMTKLWNAARFCRLVGADIAQDFSPRSVQHSINRWILRQLRDTGATIDAVLSRRRFDLYARALQSFLWNSLCDWYVELSKTLLAEDTDVARETKHVLAWVFGQFLHLLHPVAPFISETLWQFFSSAGSTTDGSTTDGSATGRRLLIVGAWPDLQSVPDWTEEVEEVDEVVALVGGCRALRSALRIPSGERPALMVQDTQDAHMQTFMERYQGPILRLARLKEWRMCKHPPSCAARVVVRERQYFLHFGETFDSDKELLRLSGQIAKADAEIARLDRKLSNHSFLERAPCEIVAQQESRKEETKKHLDVLRAAVDGLSVQGSAM